MSLYENRRFAEVGDLEQVTTHADVVRVVDEMYSDLQEHPTEWENRR
jgi:hypothetical protein